MRLLQLDSRHRSNITDDNGRSIFHLASSLKGVTSVELVQACLPHSMYTVGAPNNAFQLTQGGSTVTVTLDPSIYTLTTLATEVQSKINVNNFSCTAGQTTTLKLLFSFNAAFSIRVTSEQLAAVFGLTRNTIHTSVGNALQSQFCCELSSPSISVTSRALGSSYASGLGREVPPLYTIPVDQSAGSMLVFNSQSHFIQKKRYSNPRDISEIDIVLRDAFGSVLNMNGMPYSLVLQVHCQST